MKLSIIIPHYNDPKRLKRCLDSILSECKDTQIIVVDDRSTSEIEQYNQIVADYSRKVEFYTNTSSFKGCAGARTEALKHVTGEWLLFADSDDYLLTGWFDIVREWLESESDLILFSPTSRYEETGKESNRHILYANLISNVKKGFKGAELLAKYNYWLPLSKLIRYSVITENNITFEHVRYSDDVLFSIKVSFFAKSTAFDERQIYCITDRENSITKDLSEEAYFSHLEEFCKQSSFLDTHLSKKEWKYISVRQGALGRLNKGKKYGIGNYMKYRKLYRKYNIPLWANRCYSFDKKTGFSERLKRIGKKLSK